MDLCERRTTLFVEQCGTFLSEYLEIEISKEDSEKVMSDSQLYFVFPRSKIFLLFFHRKTERLLNQ